MYSVKMMLAALPLSATTAAAGSIVDPGTRDIPASRTSSHRCDCVLHTELVSRFARQSRNTNDPPSPHTVALRHVKEARSWDAARLNTTFPLWLDRTVGWHPHQGDGQ